MVPESSSSSAKTAVCVSGKKSKANRVSPQHTLERVRINQRRHRARQKDYIATLEQKLSEAEQVISSLREQNEILETQLAHGHSVNVAPSRSPPSCSPEAHGMGRSCSVVPGNEKTKTTELVNSHSAFPNQTRYDDDLSRNSASQRSVPVAMPPVYPAPESTTSEECCPGLDLRCEADLSHKITPHRSVTGLMGSTVEPPLEQLWTVMMSCCSSSASQPQDSMSSCAKKESTTLCSEAYILISQQNFKGIGPEDVERWLGNGFRSEARLGEGCRVKTDALFDLLTFISEA